jgi:hypothetical protein
LRVANSLIADVEMALLPWNEYGKGFIKKTRVSPDAYIQMALQLTFRRVRGVNSIFGSRDSVSESRPLLSHIRGVYDSFIPRRTHGDGALVQQRFGCVRERHARCKRNGE